MDLVTLAVAQACERRDEVNCCGGEARGGDEQVFVFVQSQGVSKLGSGKKFLAMNIGERCDSSTACR